MTFEGSESGIVNATEMSTIINRAVQRVVQRVVLHATCKRKLQI